MPKKKQKKPITWASITKTNKATKFDNNNVFFWTNIATKLFDNIVAVIENS